MLYGRDTTVEEIVSTAKRFPMMADYQVVIVKEAQNLAKTFDKFESYALNPQLTTILVFAYRDKPDGSILLIVECKQPDVAISQNTFDQIARYNFTLKATYLMVTNGINHYFCQMDFENEKYTFLKELPKYK